MNYQPVQRIAVLVAFSEQGRHFFLLFMLEIRSMRQNERTKKRGKYASKYDINHENLSLGFGDFHVF